MGAALVWVLTGAAILVAGCTHSQARAGEATAGPDTAVQQRMLRFAGGRLRPGGRGEEVEVAPFLIDVTEVTASAYAECVTAEACPKPGTAFECTFGKPGKERYPVNCVGWDMATSYCAWVGKRLPTEAEWEWAVRGGPAARIFPWGDEQPKDQLCWNGEGSPLGKGRRHGPCEVGSFPRGDSPEGLKDMAGNVLEWTATVYQGEARICRGGSWFHEDFEDVTTSRRAWRSRAFQDDALGFRCAKSL